MLGARESGDEGESEDDRDDGGGGEETEREEDEDEAEYDTESTETDSRVVSQILGVTNNTPSIATWIVVAVSLSDQRHP